MRSHAQSIRGAHRSRDQFAGVRFRIGSSLPRYKASAVPANHCDDSSLKKLSWTVGRQGSVQIIVAIRTHFDLSGVLKNYQSGRRRRSWVPKLQIGFFKTDEGLLAQARAVHRVDVCDRTRPRCDLWQHCRRAQTKEKRGKVTSRRVKVQIHIVVKEACPVGV